jgi:arylsulfatase A-like enzyme
MGGSRLAALLLGAAVCAAPAVATEPARPRGLILISIDTLRADFLGAYGASVPTPAFDGFARQGIVFENAFSAATWTLPSHATMLTGLFPSSHGAGGMTPGSGVEDLRGFSPDVSTLAEILHAHGFRTAGFHFGPVLDARWGFGRGFDVYENGVFRPGASSGTYVEDTFQKAAEWLERQDGRSPYFLFIHSFDVHRYGFIDLRDGPTCPPRFDYSQSFAGLTATDDPRCPAARERYSAAVACLDADFGRLMARLDAAGARDAAVFVVSDHGEALCEPHERSPLVGHGFPPYENQIRVPFAVRLPGGRLAGQRRPDSGGLADVVPTALDALGLASAPGLFQGRSLMRAGAGPRAIFAESDGWQMVRLAGFKYIRYRDGFEELFDLAADPAEALNLSAAPASRARLADLRARLRAFDAEQRAGLRLLVRGRRGDRFDVRVESDSPIGYARSFLTEASDRVEISSGGKVVTANFVSDEDGDEDWLALDQGVPLLGGVRSPAPALAGPSPLRIRVTLNGKPVPPRRFYVGSRPLAKEGEAVIDPGSAAAEVDALRVPADGAVVVWRLKSSTRIGGGAGDALREALKAEGYVP